MTRAQLLSEINAHVVQQGASYLESSSDRVALVNRCLAEVARLGRFWQSDDIRFNVINGLSRYDYAKPSATFTLGGANVGIVEVRAIYQKLAGDTALQVMRNLSGFIGKETISSLQTAYPNYVDTAAYPASNPRVWYVTPPSMLCLWPAPSESSEWRLDAWYAPAVPTADDSEVPLPDEIERDFALYCAYQLIYPNSVGETRAVAHEYLTMAAQRFRSFNVDVLDRIEAQERRRPSPGIYELDLS